MQWNYSLRAYANANRVGIASEVVKNKQTKYSPSRTVQPFRLFTFSLTDKNNGYEGQLNVT